MVPPLKLQGLNVVQPAQSDSNDLIAPFPDFSAHLDLWTNLAFESDEPSIQKRKLSDDDQGAALKDPVLPSVPSNPPPLDINALLAGMGVDPLLMFSSPSVPPQQVPPVPSLAQLLALHAAHSTSNPALSFPSAPAAPSVAPPTDSPTSKRARTHKSSPSVDSSSDASPSPPTQEQISSESNAPPLSAAEDKRRRNTAASARFRLKKKEREAALERRAKELEDRVVELERDCEGLRRENGWLKGLVVGVTGAGAAQQAAAK